MAARQAPLSLGFSRQEHWSGLPFPSAVHESEKWKWSPSVVSDSSRPHGPQPIRLLRPLNFLGKSIGVGCHCLLQNDVLLLFKWSNNAWSSIIVSTLVCFVKTLRLIIEKPILFCYCCCCLSQLLLLSVYFHACVPVFLWTSGGYYIWVSETKVISTTHSTGKDNLLLEYSFPRQHSGLPLFLLLCPKFVPKSHDPDVLIMLSITNQYQWNAPII